MLKPFSDRELPLPRDAQLRWRSGNFSRLMVPVGTEVDFHNDKTYLGALYSDRLRPIWGRRKSDTPIQFDAK